MVERSENRPECPRLRYLEFFPFEASDGPRLLMRDPLEISGRMLSIAPQLAELLPLLDGTRSLEAIRELFSARFQKEISSDVVERVVADLDEALFLDNDHFQSRRSQLTREYAEATTRPAWHAGKSYPNDPADLHQTINEFYLDPKGAGLPEKQEKASPLRALLAPHIDPRSGGPTYTHAYRALAESEPPDLIAIFGTGHMGLPEMFSVSPKEFVTPLGVTRVDTDFLAAFRERAGSERFVEDLTHRHEHTIEFQVVFLQHLFGAASIPIVPILASFDFEDVDNQAGRHVFEHFIAGFRHAERVTGKRVCLIGSVDLAHIGPRYGDPFEPDMNLVKSVSEQDRQMLTPVEKGDPQGFFEFVREERDARRICGFSPIYTLLTLLEGAPGTTLRHDFTFMDPSRSFVTFASLAFPSQEPVFKIFPESAGRR